MTATHSRPEICSTGSNGSAGSLSALDLVGASGSALWRHKTLLGGCLVKGTYMTVKSLDCRECYTCKKLKPISEFRRKSTSNIPRDCLECNRNYRKFHKPPPPTTPKPSQCEICGSPDTISNDHGYLLPNGKWAPRRNHALGNKRFRGWLCKRCNDIIGRAEDSHEYLEDIVKYLTKRVVG